ncbi:hypothetical protein BKA81DRAFT_138564 [Phyllosticta paracitricarpa]
MLVCAMSFGTEPCKLLYAPPPLHSKSKAQTVPKLGVSSQKSTGCLGRCVTTPQHKPAERRLQVSETGRTKPTSNAAFAKIVHKSFVSRSKHVGQAEIARATFWLTRSGVPCLIFVCGHCLGGNEQLQLIAFFPNLENQSEALRVELVCSVGAVVFGVGAEVILA